MNKLKFLTFALVFGLLSGNAFSVEKKENAKTDGVKAEKHKKTSKSKVKSTEMKK